MPWWLWKKPHETTDSVTRLRARCSSSRGLCHLLTFVFKPFCQRPASRGVKETQNGWKETDERGFSASCCEYKEQFIIWEGRAGSAPSRASNTHKRSASQQLQVSGASRSVAARDATHLASALVRHLPSPELATFPSITASIALESASIHLRRPPSTLPFSYRHPSIRHRVRWSCVDKGMAIGYPPHQCSLEIIRQFL